MWGREKKRRFISLGGGERRIREHFLMPFKNTKDITEEIMTCHPIATKDNKRNGTEP